MNKKEIENKLEKCFKRCATVSIYSGFLKGVCNDYNYHPVRKSAQFKMIKPC